MMRSGVFRCCCVLIGGFMLGAAVSQARTAATVAFSMCTGSLM